MSKFSEEYHHTVQNFHQILAGIQQQLTLFDKKYNDTNYFNNLAVLKQDEAGVVKKLAVSCNILQAFFDKLEKLLADVHYNQTKDRRSLNKLKPLVTASERKFAYFLYRSAARRALFIQSFIDKGLEKDTPELYRLTKETLDFIKNALSFYESFEASEAVLRNSDESYIRKCNTLHCGILILLKQWGYIKEETNADASIEVPKQTVQAEVSDVLNKDCAIQPPPVQSISASENVNEIKKSVVKPSLFFQLMQHRMSLFASSAAYSVKMKGIQRSNSMDSFFQQPVIKLSDFMTGIVTVAETVERKNNH